MNKTIWTIIGVVGLLLIAGLFYKSCDLYDELSVVRGQYEEAKRKAAADTVVAEQMVKDAGEIIAKQSDKIAELDKKVISNLSVIKDKDKKLVTLQNEYAAGKVGQMTDAQKITNLEAQVKTLSEMFTLSEKTVQEQRSIIGTWEVKFSEQVKISDAWKLRCENEARLHSLCRDQVKLLEKKVVGFSLKSKLTTTLVAVAGGYILYDTIRSK